MNDVIKYLKEKIEPNSSVIVATSGGPDSMALLTLINEIKKEKNTQIICAHVNHKLRKESEEEAKMVKNYCTKNNIIFEYMTINKYEGNTENYARKQRYNFFDKLSEKYDAKYLLTAHHGDDLTETVIMRIIRGSSLKGYSGFSKETKKENYEILRPLIEKTKSEILTYVQKNNIPYAIDKTNSDDTYTRNRIRKYILPTLKKENKNVHLKFLEFSKTLTLYNNYIDKEVSKIIKNVYVDKKINIKEFQKQDYLIQIKIIYKIFSEIYQNEISNITMKNVEEILKIIYSTRPNIETSIPNKIKVTKTYEYLSFESKGEKEYELKLEKNTLLPNGKTLEIINFSNDTSNNMCYLNTKEISMPLYVRTRKNGDVMKIKGSGNKKIKDIFINEKISINERNTWPILVDKNDEILWIPGLKKSKFDKTKTQNYDIIIRYH